MKNHLLRSLAFLGLVLAFSARPNARPNVTLLALAQGGGQRATGNAAAQSASPAANPNSVDVNGKKPEFCGKFGWTAVRFLPVNNWNLSDRRGMDTRLGIGKATRSSSSLLGLMKEHGSINTRFPRAFTPKLKSVTSFEIRIL